MQLAPTALKLYQQIVGEKPELKAKIDQAMGSAPTRTRLTAEQLTQLLVEAMPDQTAAIQQASSTRPCHHPDKTNGKFISTIASLLIEKERNAMLPSVARAPGRGGERFFPARDPLYAEIIMGKDADFVVLANGAVFDEQRRPLAMKVIARERADLGQIKQALSQFHTQWGDHPDIVKVANDTAYHKLADQQEGEFRFGDPVAVVSFDAKASEQGRTGMVRPQNRQITHFFQAKLEKGVRMPDTKRPVGEPRVASGPTLDDAPVQVFKEAVHLSLTPKASETPTPGAWLDERLSMFDTKMCFDRGLVLQPDVTAKARWLNSAMATEVPAEDFSFKGSPAASCPVDLTSYSGWTIQKLVSQPGMQLEVKSGPAESISDRVTHEIPFSALLYPNAADLRVGKESFQPLSESIWLAGKRADLGLDVALQPLAGEKDGVALHVRVPKGLFSTTGASLAGYTVEIGVRTGAGWLGSEPVKLDNSVSPESHFELTLPNLTKEITRELEIRLRNENGLPATRVLVPLKDVAWAE